MWFAPAWLAVKAFAAGVPAVVWKWIIIGAVCAGALWLAYSWAWQRGSDHTHAELSAVIADERAAVQAERDAAEARALQDEADQRARLDAIATQYEQDKADAQAAADRTIADLRDGTVRLRSHWQGCVATSALSGTAAAAAGADDGAGLREQGAGDLVHIGEACDAQVRGLQAVIRADRAMQ